LNPREAGFLLLTSKLGNPERHTLTVAQFRNLAARMDCLIVDRPERDLMENDLISLGYNRTMAERIITLLQDEMLLSHYVRQGEKMGCVPLTRVSEEYPQTLRRRLRLEAPGSLWAKGDLTLLQTPAISLVGSRDLREENREFAREVGRQAAFQGYTLISGNARGADREAQESCLQYGGKVISVVADSLQGQQGRENLLYLAEDGYDLPFSGQRALSRNRVIHALPTGGVFVAQCGLQTGGTWNGTEKNLRHNWSPVFCFDDHSQSQQELCNRGANAVTMAELADLYALHTVTPSLF
jgi:predicted Rossmann fold nucleotide-binding protein DprA/Smf involved in DNA uptake